MPIVPETLVSSRQRRKETRPAEFVAAALDLFVEKGFAATRLDEVAERAGASKGTLYLYFENKEALFEAVIREGVVPVIDEGLALAENFQGTPPELLQVLIRGWWSQVGATRLGGIPKLMICEAGNFPNAANYYYEQVIQRGRDLLRQVLERGIASGYFRAMAVEQAIDVVFAPVLMLALWRNSLCYCDAARHDPEAFLDTHFKLILDGLAAPSAPKEAKS